MRWKKSQVTIFIIVGIVLVFVIFLLMYLSSYLQDMKNQQTIDQLSQLIIEKQIWRTSITACLDQATERGLFLIGMQGGVIYDYQAPGAKPYLGPPMKKYTVEILPYENKNFFDNTRVIYNVSYSIREPDLGEPGHPLPPIYPYGRRPLIPDPDDPTRQYIPFINTLGTPFDSRRWPLLPPLCDYFGENRPSATGKTLSCKSYDRNDEFTHESVQEYLEFFIAERMKDCKLEEFDMLRGRDIKKGNISVNSSITPDYVSISIEFPIEIEVGSKKHTLMLKQFDTKKKVRLKQIHELVQALIYEDDNNIFFDIRRDAATLPCTDTLGVTTSCLKKGMNISKFTDVCRQTNICGDVPDDGYFDDLYMITDDTTLIGDIPYTFQFAVENRYPALDLIRTTESGTVASIYDLIVVENETIVLDPMGYDPDEDNHGQYGFMDDHYYYEGWKETYNEKFNFAACELDPDDCRMNPEDYIIRENIDMNEWTNSESYLMTRRNASYTTNHDDIGEHIVRIKVCDNSDVRYSCDYQNVKILVQNKPILGGERTYPDIPPSFASVEDPFMISAFLFRNVDNIDYYLFDDVSPLLLDDFDLIKSINESIRLPDASLPPFATYDITDITNYAWTKTGLHKVSLNIMGKMPNSTDPVSIYSGFFDVNVTKCLPHRSTSPVYPFNTSDGFSSNHTCCLGDPYGNAGDWKIAPAGTPCYSKVEYGCYRNFDDYPGVPITILGDLTGEPADLKNSNSVWMRTIEGSCDGTRGNVCQGANLRDIREKKQNCDTQCMFCQEGEQVCGYSVNGTPCNAGMTTCTMKNGKPIYDTLNGNKIQDSENINGQDVPMMRNLCGYACDGFGNCNIAINCTCDNNVCTPGPECKDATDFDWDKTEAIDGFAYCSYDCDIETCYFNENDAVCPDNNGGLPTGCLDPRSCTGACCLPNMKSTNCITGVTCDASGPHYGSENDYCLEAGEIMLYDVAENEFVCFDNSEPPNKKCDNLGACKSVSAPLKCDGGENLAAQTACSVYSTKHCSSGGNCLIVDTPGQGFCSNSGWNYKESTELHYGMFAVGSCPLGTNCSGGYYFDPSPMFALFDTSVWGYCYSSFDCTDSGWEANVREACPKEGVCEFNNYYHNSVCDETGCSYDVDTRPICASGYHSCCDSSGWRCEPLANPC